MATMIEKKAASITKELEKYNTQLARRTTLLEKKAQKCIKLGCNWTPEEFFSRRNTVTDEQWAAYLAMDLARDEVAETVRKIENATDRMNKLLPQLEQIAAEAEENLKISELEKGLEKALSWKEYLKAEKEFKKWLESFKADCLKDGIIIENYSNHLISGSLKNGKTFALYINDGYTERSMHCYTLYINQSCIFTSGLFETAYKLLRN